MIGSAAPELVANRAGAGAGNEQVVCVKRDKLGNAPFGKMPGMAGLAVVLRW
jgi:hypothetical protein